MEIEHIMTTLFISDLHLSPNQPALTRLFLYFLQNQAKQAEALYILGDLFESWIGDDDESPFNQQIIMALAELTASGISTYFMPGNRDFLIGSRFIEKTGCKYLADPTSITLYGIPTLLTHGDSLCTLDKHYIYFRRLTRTHFLQTFFLKLPLAFRKKIARYLRSVDHVSMPNDPKFDVVMHALFNCLKHYPTELVIHGHTHQPCIQLIQPYKQSLCRVVLSDWNPISGNVLIVTPNKRFELINFS